MDGALESGPIIVCTRNDDLAAVVQATPPSRRGGERSHTHIGPFQRRQGCRARLGGAFQLGCARGCGRVGPHADLVFIQNGMLQPWLDAQELGDNTQVSKLSAWQRCMPAAARPAHPLPQRCLGTFLACTAHTPRLRLERRRCVAASAACGAAGRKSFSVGPTAAQVLVFFAVAKKGDKPTDGKTDVNPEGLTAGEPVRRCLCARLRVLRSAAQRAHSRGCGLKSRPRARNLSVLQRTGRTRTPWRRGCTPGASAARWVGGRAVWRALLSRPWQHESARHAPSPRPPHPRLAAQA